MRFQIFPPILSLDLEQSIVTHLTYIDTPTLSYFTYDAAVLTIRVEILIAIEIFDCDVETFGENLSTNSHLSSNFVRDIILIVFPIHSTDRVVASTRIQLIYGEIE